MSDVATETQSDTKFNAEAFAMNIARAMESSGQALAAYLKPRESGEAMDKPPSELAEVIKTLKAAHTVDATPQRAANPPISLVSKRFSCRPRTMRPRSSTPSTASFRRQAILPTSSFL